MRIRGGARVETVSFVLEGKARPAAEISSNAQRATCRFGFTVTKRLGNAVVRNRIRRRLRESVRKIAPGAARGGMDYVLVARSAAATRDFAELCRDLDRALARAHRGKGAQRGAARRGADRP
jgi:ribonuclease P protein component